MAHGGALMAPVLAAAGGSRIGWDTCYSVPTVPTSTSTSVGDLTPNPVGWAGGHTSKYIYY